MSGRATVGAVLAAIASLAGAASAQAVAGGRIVFARSTGPHATHIWSINPDGSRARQLTHARGGIDLDPELSPDGRTVVFSRSDDEDTDLFTVGVDGSHERRVLRRRGSQRNPSYSPDGSDIVFDESDAGGNTHVAVVNADGSAVESHGVEGYGAEFSP